MSDDSISGVPLLDLKAQYRTIREPIRAAIDEVCDSQYFVMGPNVQAFEAQVANYCASGHGIGVSSGTDALLLALMALEVGPGHAVITSPYTFFATAGAISRLGATPVFCDIRPDSYNIDPQALAALIDEQCVEDNGQLVHRPSGTVVKALLPVHLYGQTADMDAIMTIANQHQLFVIEDAAQSIGAEYVDGGRAGSRGHIGCFSFFPSKNLGAFGDGGLCTCNDNELAERLRILRVHGGKPKYYHKMVGGNFRLDAIQAAILSVKLERLDDWTAGRQANADYYTRKIADVGLGEHVSVPVQSGGSRHIYNQYVLRVSDRDGLREHLATASVGTEIYYPVPLHLQECFAYLGYGEGDFPESEKAAKQTVAVPIYPELTEQQQDYVVDKIADFYS